MHFTGLCESTDADLNSILELLKRGNIKTFCFYTLGCKVNQSESDELDNLLEKTGLKRSQFQAADIIFINSCAVTAEAEAKTRKILRRAIRSGAGVVVLMGCAARSIKETLDVTEENKDVIYLDNKQKLKLIKILAETKNLMPVPFPAERTRAFLKIQDGCNQRCSYCIVPLVRGNEICLRKEEVLLSVRKLNETGVKEIVLTGIHLGRYHDPENKDYMLSDLLADIASIIDGRVRLSSVDVYEIPDELLYVMRDLREKVCPHLHIPLQSGSDKILKLMRRPYTSKEFIEKIERVREIAGEIAISTDIMVGFPGETDEDFRQTLEVVESVQFMRAHIFRYSERPGTPAAQFSEKVSEKVKKEREKTLMEIAKRHEKLFLKSLEGRTLNVLVEEHIDGLSAGKSEFYTNVKICSVLKRNELYKVKVMYRNEELFGEVLR